MSAQPDAESSSYCPATLQGSEESEEETSQEEPPVTSWSELSIIERVGLNSVEMSEKEVESPQKRYAKETKEEVVRGGKKKKKKTVPEQGTGQACSCKKTAFSQIALAFRCDQYTLKQRLQAEEHARNLAEENIQLELTRGRETLETLKGLCLDTKRSKILQRLELSLDILGGTVERISNTAEVLGAVHQEARVSRAVELMVAHVDNLRRRHDRNAAELEEARRVIQQQNSCRNFIDPRASPDPDDSDSRMKSYQQNNSRRRVSISVIPSKPQERTKEKKDQKKRSSHRGSTGKKYGRSASLSSESSCSVLIKDDSHLVDERPPDPGETPCEASCGLPPQEPTPVPEPECLSSKQPTPKTTQGKNSPPHSLRQRHKARSALCKKKGDKDKKDTKIHRRLSAGKCGPQWRHRPLVHWLYHCRWSLLCLYLLVLFCAISLTLFLLEAS